MALFSSKTYKKEKTFGFCAILCSLFSPLFSYGDLLPRRVLTFWDSCIEQSYEDSLVHRMLEMPLNHIGLDVIYYDIQDPLPDLSQRTDILGVIICFQEQTKMQSPSKFIDWTVQAIEMGKKIILMRNGGFYIDQKGNYTPGETQNRLYERLGVINTQKYIAYPFDYRILSEKNDLIDFERSYPSSLFPFYLTKINDPNAKSYLKVGIQNDPTAEADLIVLHPNGAYISDFYANSYQFNTNPRAEQWYINPFLLFEKVFHIEGRPIPDTTTLVGRRIFYSTLHGDGWNTETVIETWKNKGILCSNVLLKEVIEPYPDIPVTVGVVAADVDPSWVAKPSSQTIARNYFLLPQVESASHTYSHPFEWSFFKTGGAEKEIYFLHNYPYGGWQNSFLSWFRAQYYSAVKNHEKNPKQKSDSAIESDTTLKWKYVIPRAYANEPFDLKKEIFGSVQFLNNLAPSWNQVRILIWSGDGRPWDLPVHLCREAGLQQMGGGFVRFDDEYPSLLFVYPLGRKPGSEVQIYASSNAENSYTEGWSTNFYGFQYLPKTLENTESPRRIKPILLYYHSYSGEFSSSLQAVLKNIRYIKSQNPISIHASRFCTVGEGFYSIEIEQIGPSQWTLHNRKGLQTIRFDNAENTAIDFSLSQGVLGFTHYQGSLYVYLDPAVLHPILATTSSSPSIPSLIESSWEIWNLESKTNSVLFSAKGWGKLEMRWNMSEDGSYLITASPIAAHLKKDTVGKILSFELDLPYNQEIHIDIHKQ